MLMSFVAVYTDGKGQFRHGAFQSVGITPVDKYRAALALHDMIREWGFIPIMIGFVPGERSMPELEKIAEYGPTDDLQLLYAPEKVLKTMN